MNPAPRRHSASILRRAVRRLSPRALRNWMRNPRASVRWLWSAWRWRRGGAVVLDCGGGAELRCHPESARTFRAFLDDPACAAEFAAFRALAKPGLRLYDLGAHYGFFSLAALVLGGATSRALAVEPSPQAFQILSANIGLAGAAARATAIHAAVGPADGRLAMISGGVASENYMYAAEAGRPDAVTVPQYSLPGLEFLCGWHPTLLKLDVEGFEYEFFASMANLEALYNWGPVLLLELHCDLIRGRGHRPESVLDALARIGYRAPELDLAAPLLRLALRPGEATLALPTKA